MKMENNEFMGLGILLVIELFLVIILLVYIGFVKDGDCQREHVQPKMLDHVITAPPKEPTLPLSTYIQMYNHVSDVITKDTRSVSTEPPEVSNWEDEALLESQKQVYNILSRKVGLDRLIWDVALQYEVDPYLVKAVIFRESGFNPDARNGTCVGLMQVSTKWHKDRAAKLGVIDWYDPYSNIRLGTSYLKELINLTPEKSITYALMRYNMRKTTADEYRAQGRVSKYATTIINLAEKYRQEDFR